MANILDKIYEKAKLAPQRVAFPEGDNEKIMQAAFECATEGYILPILVGDTAALKALCAERGYDESVFSFVDTTDEAVKADLIAKYLALPTCELSEKALIRRM